MTELKKAIEAEHKPPAETKTKRKRSAYRTLRESSSDGEAKRLCAIILEVLGGVRTPSDAASALGVSAPRYYALEARALSGMLKACQRRAKGRKRTAESELEQLKRSHGEILRERDRLGALLRASQRAMGLPRPQKPEHSEKKRKRRPQVRALRASKSLRSEETLPASDKSMHDTTVVKG